MDESRIRLTMRKLMPFSKSERLIHTSVAVGICLTITSLAFAQTPPSWEKYEVIPNITEAGHDFCDPALADLNGDGRIDLVVGWGGFVTINPFSGTLSWYVNTGTPAAPAWTPAAPGELDTGTAGLDVGTAASPTFADLDGDGDYDLAVGQAEDLIDPWNFYWYRNTGTTAAPIWTLDTTLATGMTNEFFFINSTPSFGDMDGDGDPDMLVGNSSGDTKAWRNDCGVGINPPCSGVGARPTWVRVSAWDVGSIGSDSRPSLADLDLDGDVDLGIGEYASMFINWYRNDGAPAWVSDPTYGSGFVNGMSEIPLDFADYIDNDGDADLVIGGACSFAPSGVRYYRNTSVSPAFVDCGLRARINGVTVTIACEEPGSVNSPLRIYKPDVGDGIYGIGVVDVSDIKATSIQIETSSGLKALREL